MPAILPHRQESARAQALRPFLQVAPFRLAVGALRGQLVRVPRGGRVAGHLQQVRAYRREPMVAR